MRPLPNYRETAAQLQLLLLLLASRGLWFFMSSWSGPHTVPVEDPLNSIRAQYLRPVLVSRLFGMQPAAPGSSQPRISQID